MTQVNHMTHDGVDKPIKTQERGVYERAHHPADLCQQSHIQNR